MLRLIAASTVLGLGAIGWALLLTQPAKLRMASTPVAAPADAAPVPVPPPAEPVQDIRVVYPGPDATAQVRKLTDKVPANGNPLPAVATAQEAPTTDDSAMLKDVAAAQSSSKSADPAAAVTTPSVETAPQTAALVATDGTDSATVTPAPVNGQAININTASVDALNQLPGGGRIGRTIASHRPYRSIEELLSKRVVRKSVYARIKDQIAAN